MTQHSLLVRGVKTPEGWERTTGSTNNAKSSKKGLGEFTAPKEGTKINNRSFHLNKLESEEQMKPKVNRRKEVTKKRVSMKWKMKNNRETMMKPQGRALQSFLQPGWLRVREVVSYWWNGRGTSLQIIQRRMDHKKKWRPRLISWCPDMHRWADAVKRALTGATWRQSSGALVNVWSTKQWGDPNAPGVPAQTLVTDRRS